MNPLVELRAYGQSFWYDNIRRRYLHDGTLRALIDGDGLRGMTSNPAIFEKAIAGSDDYDDQLAELAQTDAGTIEIYEQLALQDIRTACDLFAALYHDSNRGDGYVSLEVSPTLAQDTPGTIAEARRLHAAVDRPNLMIKVPATDAGIPAIRQLISEGINVNITLMFNMSHYEKVAQAYIDGVTQLLENGGDPTQIASVASFFVSRVDSAVDKKLEELDDPAAETLLGKVAIANSKLVYQRYKKIFHGADFSELRSAGAPVQRLLWASTSAKNPAYPDTLYIDSLIGAETVNTMPPKTVDAFRDHGYLSASLETGATEAMQTLEAVANLGINLDEITEELQRIGVEKFAAAFESLLAAVEDEANKMRESAAV